MIEYRNLRIALLGAGSVGAQVASLLLEHGEELSERVGAGLELVGVAVRDLDAPRSADIPAGLLTTDARSLILGADIGTTFTVQLIAFRITDYALVLVGLGFVITAVAGRRTAKDVGHAVLGLGLMFLGLKLILDGVEPLRSNPLAVQMIGAVADSPLMAVLVAAAFSAIVASSAASFSASGPNASASAGSSVCRASSWAQ